MARDLVHDRSGRALAEAFRFDVRLLRSRALGLEQLAQRGLEEPLRFGSDQHGETDCNVDATRSRASTVRVASARRGRTTRKREHACCREAPASAARRLLRMA